MQGSFHARCVITGNHRMHVEFEWNTCIPELTKAAFRFQATGHANFEDLLAKRIDVRNNVNMAGSGLLRH